MATRDRVAAALNFLTGEGVEYSPDSCDDKSIEALILDYFDGSGNDEGSGSNSEESLDESDRNNEGSIHSDYNFIIIIIIYRAYAIIQGWVRKNYACLYKS